MSDGPDVTHSDSLRLLLDVPSVVEPGQAVPVRLSVRNTGGRPLELYLRGREIAFDVIVADSAGARVWSRLHGEIIPAIVRLEVLDAGAELALTAEWRQVRQDGSPAGPGRYTVWAELLTEGEPLVTEAALLRITRSP